MSGRIMGDLTNEKGEFIGKIEIGTFNIPISEELKDYDILQQIYIDAEYSLNKHFKQVIKDTKEYINKINVVDNLYSYDIRDTFDILGRPSDKDIIFYLCKELHGDASYTVGGLCYKDINNVIKYIESKKYIKLKKYHLGL